MIRVLMSFAVLLTASIAAAERVDRDLVAFYDFGEGEGTVVHDGAGAGEPLDLEFEASDGVRWQDGALAISSDATIATPRPPARLLQALQRSNALTLEVWLRPARTDQTGPARIVSISRNPSERNLTLGQETSAIDVRLRTTETSGNGIPSTSSEPNTLLPELTHVVFTRDAGGAARIYRNGVPVANGRVGGRFSGWDARHRLVFANELTGDRPWHGELHLIAIYSRALSPAEVQQNFAAGHDQQAKSAEERARERMLAEQTRAFNQHVAPLFARHCLECHDSALSKGGLDLSRRTRVLAGGDSGPAISPGDAESSLLWQYVDSDEMPKERAPLSAEEKATLRRWIDGGAVWSAEVIDPVIYVHQQQAREVWVQRLTVAEYIETVRSATGVDIAQEARDLLPRDLRADGFSNTAYNLGVDLKHIDAWARLAELIVDRMDVPQFVARFSKSRAFNDDKLREVISDMGEWLLRGPLSEREISIFRGIASGVSSAGGDYDDAMRAIVEAMLQSPRFIYRIENQHGSGSRRTVGSWELASRLSYILWGGPPDAELFAAARRGDLIERGAVAEQVDRMLQDERAVERSRQFIAEWLNLGRLNNLRPDPDRFPDWSDALADAMRRETLDYFEEIVWNQNRPMSDLLNAQLTFASPRLARHYGLPRSGDDWQRYDLSDIPARGGILTQGSVLTVGGDDASMVSRGLFVLHELLRGTVNAPPPCVDTTPPPTKEGLTQRGIAEQRIADTNCGVCHARFEPLAFGLEKFDGVGSFHEQDEHGNPLRDDGEILFPGEAKPVAYQSSKELMNLLAAHERVRESFTWKLAQFALGRPPVAADAPIIAEVHARGMKNGGTYADLIREIVLSDLVLQTRTEAGSTGPVPPAD